MRITIVVFLLSLLCCNTLFSQKTLKDALKGRFYIGTAMNLQQISGKDAADVNVIKQNFDAIVAENQPFNPTPAGYDSTRDSIACGTVETIEYLSQTVGANRKATIYTPPGYSKSKKYPVLY